MKKAEKLFQGEKGKENIDRLRKELGGILNMLVGEKAGEYGDPAINLGTAGRLMYAANWGYFQRDTELTEEEYVEYACVMLEQLKIARKCTNENHSLDTHRDDNGYSVLGLAGYLARTAKKNADSE